MSACRDGPYSRDSLSFGEVVVLRVLESGFSSRVSTAEKRLLIHVS
jgi:hypothetical protein